MSPERVLQNEYKELSKERWVNISLENESLLRWTVDLMILNSESLYYGGYFRGKMTFPATYPYAPPQFSFSPPLFHPNIYPDGKLCISILHPPGDDEMSGELASERWSPAQRVETVLLSIISLLDDAEISSPANVDAAKLFRDDKEEYKRRVAQDVENSKKNIPAGFVVPTDEVLQEANAKAAKAKQDDDADFWAESDEDFDFGSDTEEEGDEMGEDAGMGDEEEDDDDDDDKDSDDGDEVKK